LRETVDVRADLGGPNQALLHEHGFGPRRAFEAILAARGGRAVGFALYFFTFSTFTGRPTLYLVVGPPLVDALA
jgi:hypothetical protein